MNNEEMILQMLTRIEADVSTLKTDVKVLDAKVDKSFAELNAKVDKNFADLADSQAHITEVVGAALGDLPASVQELKDVTQQLTYDYVLVKKRIAL